MVSEPEALLRLVLAAAFGALIGLEREARDKPAGVRTFAIVAVGAALFTLIGLMAFGDGDPAARVAAQIVTGVGFLGAGTILRHAGAVVGLTTAAGIWAAAAVGMGFGTGLYLLSIAGSLVMLAILRFAGALLGEDDRHPGGGGEAATHAVDRASDATDGDAPGAEGEQARPPPSAGG